MSLADKYVTGIVNSHDRNMRGMTLLEHYAGLAMQAQLASSELADPSPEGVAKYSVIYARALIAELEKEAK